jgi:electron transfer flavoprotein alpha subunit
MRKYFILILLIILVTSNYSYSKEKPNEGCKSYPPCKELNKLFEQRGYTDCEIIREVDLDHDGIKDLIVKVRRLKSDLSPYYLVIVSMKKHKPEIFLIGASEFGKELAARIAKRIGVGLGADCISLNWDEEKESLIGFSPAFGGNFLARIGWSSSRPYMATLSPGTFPERAYDQAAHGEIVKVGKEFGHVSSRVNVISSVREPHHTARLEDARAVVVGGRGIKNSQGFDNIRELALLLGGEVGATRPAVDAHWTSHEQLIGQTGKTISPKLYIACGVSGAVQHLVGMQSSEVIVAVNKIDLPDVCGRIGKLEKELSESGAPLHFISAATGEGVSELMAKACEMLDKVTPTMQSEKMAVFHPQPKRERVTVAKEGKTFVVSSQRAQKMVARMDLNNPEARAI